MGEVAVGMMVPKLTHGAFIREFAMAAEAAGVESVWTIEHVVMGAEYEPRYSYSATGRIPDGAERSPMADPLEVLSFIAAVTDQLVLGTGVVIAPLHSPVVLAKRAATLDRLSGGRLLLGLGNGWQKEEYDAVGVPFGSRGHRLTEAIPAMRALWSDSPATYRGESVSFDRVYMLPQPERKTIPIILGGNSEAAIRRTALLADGWYPHAIAPEQFALGVERLAAVADACGRSIEDIGLTVSPASANPDRFDDVEFVRGYVKAGARRIILLPPIRHQGDVAGLPGFVDRYHNDVLARL